jgi:hypothetical protein
MGIVVALSMDGLVKQPHITSTTTWASETETHRCISLSHEGLRGYMSSMQQSLGDVTRGNNFKLAVSGAQQLTINPSSDLGARH